MAMIPQIQKIGRGLRDRKWHARKITPTLTPIQGWWRVTGDNGAMIEEDAAICRWCLANASRGWRIFTDSVVFRDEGDARLFYLAFA